MSVFLLSKILGQFLPWAYKTNYGICIQKTLFLFPNSSQAQIWVHGVIYHGKCSKTLCVEEYVGEKVDIKQ